MTRSWNPMAVLLLALASVCPASACRMAPPGNAPWPHEPVGFRVIVDEPFDAVAENGWQCGCTPLVTIVSRTTVALSPLPVLQFSYPIGFHGRAGTRPLHSSLWQPRCR